MTHYVYRAFDSYGLLLYIGCTSDVARRMGQHRSSSPWHRYAETYGTWGPFPQDEALRFESHAINTEGSYFNSTPADMKRTQANRVAATQILARLGQHKPSVDLDRYDAEGEAYAAEHDAEYGIWDSAREGYRRRLKDSGRYPYLTDADRLARYLAAREGAEFTRQAVA